MTADPDAPPSEEEVRESERLREALADPSQESPDADLLRAVKHAVAPSTLTSKELDATIARALGAGKKRSGAAVVRVAFGAGVLLAMAAAVVLILGRSSSPQAPTLARARSTQPLFADRFESRGGESARIDRIALARAADLRDNHFARWGVR